MSRLAAVCFVVLSACQHQQVHEAPPAEAPASVGPLLDDLEVQGKTLTAVQDALDAARDRGPDRRVAPFDQKLAQELEQAKLAAPDLHALATARIDRLPPKLADALLQFYVDDATLAKLVQDHVRLSKIDAKGARPSGAAAFGVILREATDGGPALAEVGQLGSPVCDDGKPHDDGCGASAPAAVLFRTDPNRPWMKKAIATAPATDKVVIVADTPVLTALVAGGGPSTDRLNDAKRVAEIGALVETLLVARRELVKQLEILAHAS